MKKLLIVFICACLVGCNRIQDQYISDQPQDILKGEVILSSENNLNVFYDIIVLEDYIACLDFYSDSILKIYDNTLFPEIKKIFLKGNGPNDLILPFFSKKCTDNDRISMVELNAQSFKFIDIEQNINNIKTVQMDMEMPFIGKCNLFTKNIVGMDADMNMNRLFFIYDKNTKKTQSINYYPHVSSKIDQNSLFFLYEGSLIANELKNSICIVLKKLNSIQFYDFSGKLIKSIIMGAQLNVPQGNGQFLDFPESPIFFTDVCGTSSYVYCLCRDYKNNKLQSKVYIFDWNGNFKYSYLLDYKIKRMAVSANNEYIWGLHVTKEGGTDIVRFKIHGFSDNIDQ